jgi:hypothetical protein
MLCHNDIRNDWLLDALLGLGHHEMERTALMTDLETSAAPDNMRPSSNLVSSDKHSGKTVYGTEDKKIGSIESVMVDNSTGEPAYAVLSIGGVLGMGGDRYPVPWRLLRYDSELDGYRSDISGSRLQGGPKHGSDSVFEFAEHAELDSYYDNIDTVTTKAAEESPLTRSSG